MPVSGGVPGAFTTLALSGPAAQLPGQFNNNGIQATADGGTLLFAHTAEATVNLVDAVTDASRTISAEWQLSGDLSSGRLRTSYTSPLFEVPTTVARLGDRLVAANAKLDTGLPPTASSYEAVVIKR